VFLDHLQGQDAEYLDEVFQRLRATIGDEPPLLWMLEIGETQTPAVTTLQNEGISVALTDIIRDPVARQDQLGCIALVLERAGQDKLLPAASTLLQPGDQILLCGSRHARRLLEATLNNVYTLQYLVTGSDRPRSYLLKWLLNKAPVKAKDFAPLP
jgi:hypothetical protein